MNDLHSIDAHRQQAEANIIEGNTAAVFDALAAANITEVHHNFDSEGGLMLAFAGAERVELPTVTITIEEIQNRKPQPLPVTCTVKEAIKALCFDYLENKHFGWDCNDAAHGKFHLDVVQRTIELVFLERGE